MRRMLTLATLMIAAPARATSITGSTTPSSARRITPTPTKPSTIAAQVCPLIRSLSHSQATSGRKKGTVIFTSTASASGIWAMVKKKQNMAVTPVKPRIKCSRRWLVRKSRIPPLATSTGNSTARPIRLRPNTIISTGRVSARCLIIAAMTASRPSPSTSRSAPLKGWSGFTAGYHDRRGG